MSDGKYNVRGHEGSEDYFLSHHLTLLGLEHWHWGRGDCLLGRDERLCILGQGNGRAARKIPRPLSRRLRGMDANQRCPQAAEDGLIFAEDLRNLIVPKHFSL